MKWFLVLCALLAVTNFAICRPDKDKEPDYGEVLNDDDGYANIGDDDDDDIEDDRDDAEQSDPPVMKSRNQIFRASEGESVILPCDTENAEAYSVMWKVNEIMIYQDKIRVGKRNDRIHRFDNQSLQIRQIQSSDDGEYECSISTSPLIFVKHQLTVLSPPRITKATANKKTSVSVERGGSVELECFAEGNPVPKVSWSKDGHRVSAEHVEYGTSRIYKQNVGRDDHGLYVCIADNENKKEPAMQTVNVEVTHKPDMKIERVIAGDTELHLICKVHANPNANVTWIRKNKPVKENDNIIVEHSKYDHILKFKKVDESVFGNYTCFAGNSYGFVEKFVDVNGTPLTPKYENHRYIGDNNELKTKWTVMTLKPVEKIQLQYRRKGDSNKTWNTETTDINEEGKFLNEIEHVLKNLDQGVYEARLRAKNSYGWSDYSRAISVEGKSSADSISQKEDSTDDKTEEPASSINLATRTIHSWTTVLTVVLLSLYSSFI